MVSSNELSYFLMDLVDCLRSRCTALQIFAEVFFMCHQIGRFLNEPARSPSLSPSTCHNFLRIGLDNLLLPVIVTILFGQVLMLVIWFFHNSIQEAQLMAEEKCNTMEEEVEMKTRKLRKLMARYQQSKNELSALRTELQDTIHEFQRERTDMFLSLRSLDQQLQLKNFLIDKFIPPEEMNKVMRRVHWDEENETWNLVQNTMPLRSVPYNGPTRISIDGFTKQPLLRPNSAIGRSRPPLRQPEQPLSQSERDRYLVDNILKMDLEMSEGRNPFEFDKTRASNDADAEHALRELRTDEGPYFSYDTSAPKQPAPALASARPKSARTKHHRHARPQSASR